MTTELPMSRDDVTALGLAAKRSAKMSWKHICGAINPKVSPVVVTAALLGQMKLKPDEAKKAAELLSLPAEAEALLQEVPYRGSLPPGPPTDPLIYRFYELVQVYGTTW